MSNSVIRYASFINTVTGEVSAPFQIYVRKDVEFVDKTPVRVTEATSINPKTGDSVLEIKVSGEGIIRSHKRDWMVTIASGYVTTSDTAIIVPATFALPSVEEVEGELAAGLIKVW
jgi:hypothetical protein